MKRNTYGFTLIEVVLVLAIAGMIFGLTFFILPTIWANERDGERRADMLTFMDTLKAYQKNNSRGNLPGNTTTEQTLLNSDRRVQVLGSEVVDDRARADAEKLIKEPTSWAGFYRDYFTADFDDPAGYPYDLEIMKCELSSDRISVETACNATGLQDEIMEPFRINDPEPTIYVVLGASCDGATPVKSANGRKVAVIYRQERSGPYCYTD